MPAPVDRDLPLSGITVVEFHSVAPAPLASRMLSDFGADVILVERPGGNSAGMPMGDFGPVMSRGKRSIVLDLRDEADLAVARSLAQTADVLIEGYRPGVLERLGLGPDELMATNPGLIYTRLTGWGQDGPFAQRMGHDINYIAVAGALAQVGTAERPVPPSAFVGDFASGSLMAVIGVLLALVERTSSGRGQIVDAAIVDGAVHLLSPILEIYNRGRLQPRGGNVMEGEAPYYRAYECADGRWYTVGAVESKLYVNLLAELEITGVELADQDDREQWPALRDRIAAVFRTRTRDEWEERLGHLDVSGAPVLDIEDLVDNAHIRERGLIDVREGGWLEARPAPRLTATPGHAGEVVSESGQHGDEIRAQLERDPGSFPTAVPADTR